MADPSDLSWDCADFPLTSGIPSAHASLGLHLATRTPPSLPILAFGSLDRVLEAHARGALALGDTIRVDGWTSTVGRHLVAACLPRSFRDAASEPWDAGRGAVILDAIARELHVELAARAVAALERLGRHVADRSGFSLAMADFAPPRSAPFLIAEAAAETAQLNEGFEQGLYTDGECWNRTVEIWAAVAETIRSDAQREAPQLDPLAACAAGDPSTPYPEDLRSIRGVRTAWNSTAGGQRGTFSDGFGCHEYFLACAETRAHAVAAEKRSRDAQVLLHDLLDAIGDLQIVAVDCGTTRGVRVAVPDDRAHDHHAHDHRAHDHRAHDHRAHDDGAPAHRTHDHRAHDHRAHDHGAPAHRTPTHLGADLRSEPIAHELSLAHAIDGRVTAEAVVLPTGSIMAAAGALITPAIGRQISAARVPSVVVRDPRTCEALGGVCARCFGLAPEDAIWPSVGDRVGARAALVIATAAASHLHPDNAFHVC